MPTRLSTAWGPRRGRTRPYPLPARDAGATTGRTTITARTPIATLISLFTVEPDLPGFVPANLHASTDRTRAVDHAQWESPQAFDAMLVNPAARQHMNESAKLATRFEPHLYRVESVRHRWPAVQRLGSPLRQASNLYPSPRTVTRCRGADGSASTFERSRLTCTSRVLVSPT